MDEAKIFQDSIITLVQIMFENKVLWYQVTSSFGLVYVSYFLFLSSYFLCLISDNLAANYDVIVTDARGSMLPATSKKSHQTSGYYKLMTLKEN